MKILFSIGLIFSIFISSPLSALTCGAEGKDSPVADLYKVINKIDDQDAKVCWALDNCPMLLQPKPPTFPANFKCKRDAKTDESKRCNLSSIEAIAIQSYTSSSFACINSYLRQKTIKSEELDLVIKTLNQTLDKLPDYEGFVIRRAVLPPARLAQHQPGKVLTYEGFTSAATNTQDFGHQTFYIFSKTGKPIMSLSGKTEKQENEVLFKSGTNFKILQASGDDPLQVFIMTEYTGDLSSADQDKFEKEILKKVNTKNVGDRYDTWECPHRPDQMPKKIMQNIVPSVSGF